MARIDWALACSLAFFDREDRLCIVGIAHRLTVPELPLAIPELMLVASLVEVSAVDQIEVGVTVVAPSGSWTRPNEDDVLIETGGEYVLVTLRRLPLMEEGIHHLRISLRGHPPISIEIPVGITDASLLGTAH